MGERTRQRLFRAAPEEPPGRLRDLFNQPNALQVASYAWPRRDCIVSSRLHSRIDRYLSAGPVRSPDATDLASREALPLFMALPPASLSTGHSFVAAGLATRPRALLYGPFMAAACDGSVCRVSRTMATVRQTGHLHTQTPWRLDGVWLNRTGSIYQCFMLNGTIMFTAVGEPAHIYSEVILTSM